MGRRGPPPKSAEVLRRTGNPGHRAKGRLEASALTLPTRVPACPSWVKGEARREFRRVGRLLEQRGTITELDRNSLVMLCVEWARHIEAETAFRALDPVEQTGKTGLLLVKINMRAMKNILLLARQFGMTPASRASIAPDNPPQKPGGWDASAGKGK